MSWGPSWHEPGKCTSETGNWQRAPRTLLDSGVTRRGQQLQSQGREGGGGARLCLPCLGLLGIPCCSPVYPSGACHPTGASITAPPLVPGTE